MRARALVAAALLSVAGSACAAQTIYRCGTEGNVIYAQTPCPEGRVVDATDPRSAAQRADARRVAAVERKQAAEMARERKRQEAEAKERTAPTKPTRSSAASAAERKHGKGKATPVIGLKQAPHPPAAPPKP